MEQILIFAFIQIFATLHQIELLIYVPTVVSEVSTI